MAATLPLIRITRPGGPYRDSLRAYRVEIDGQKAGIIRPGQTIDFPVPPGEHGVRLTVDWCSSPLRVVRLGEGQWTQFVCRPKGWFFEVWRTVIDTGNYIRLDWVPGGSAT
jgi:hypothetical protein